MDIRDHANPTKSWLAPIPFTIGLLFFIQSVVIIVLIALQEYPGQSLESMTSSLFGCSAFWLWAWYLSVAGDRRRRLKEVLIFVGIAYVCLGLAPRAVEVFHDRQVKEQARQWFARAQEDAKPTWTKNDAIRWLHDHDIQPYRSAVANAVIGYREIEEGSRIFTPATVCMTFVFDGHDKFRRVQYEFWPFRSPSGNKSVGKPAQ